MLIRISVRFETFGNVFLFTHSIIFSNAVCLIIIPYSLWIPNVIRLNVFAFCFLLFFSWRNKKISLVCEYRNSFDWFSYCHFSSVYIWFGIVFTWFSSWLSMSYRVCYTRRIQCAYSLNRESNEQHRLECIDTDWKFFVVNGIYWMNALILTPFTAFDFDC